MLKRQISRPAEKDFKPIRKNSKDYGLLHQIGITGVKLRQCRSLWKRVEIGVSNTITPKAIRKLMSLFFEPKDN